MEEWKEYKLGEVLTIKYGKDHKQIADGHIPIYGSGGIMRYGEQSLYEGPSILIPRKGSLNNIMYSDKPFWTVDTMFWTIINEDMANPLFVYYSICKKDFASLNVGSAVPSLTVPVIEDIDIQLPSKETQNRIVTILKSLDDKIEVNRRINDNFYFAFLEVMLIWILTSLRNDNLEQQAQALFKSWFVDFEPFRDQPFVESELGMIPEGWKVDSLSSIADYINGLAMQKYRPTEGEVGLPVLKIKELGQGNTDDSSELCSPSLIGEKYIIDDGDIIFSWSGTLMVKVWCGGKCGLNQHLFVVEPKDYPHWFAYQWTKHHLDNFIHIAKDKAVTMGHIKRGELDKAKVLVPDRTSMAAIDSMMKPLHSQIISNKIESRRLAELRDTLLPRLMSGELKLNA